MPTFIVINMSGVMWWPSWMFDAEGAPGDVYGDPLLLRSQALLVDTCAGALAGDTSIRAFDLTNEIDDAQRPRSRHAAWVWARLLAGCAPPRGSFCAIAEPSRLSDASVDAMTNAEVKAALAKVERFPLCIHLCV